MSTGLLQFSDAQVYTVRLLGIYSGSLGVEVRIKCKCVIVLTIWVILYTADVVTGTETIMLHWMNPTTITILPDAPSGYSINPAFPTGIELNNTGHLVTTGQRQHSDAGTHQIMAVSTPKFVGTLTLILQISGKQPHYNSQIQFHT